MLDTKGHLHYTRLQCQPRSTSPAFPPNPSKGLVHASSAGSAARCGASLSAPSPSPVSCGARPCRKPTATTPRRMIRKPARQGGCRSRTGRAPLSPPRRFRHLCSRVCSPPVVTAALRPRPAPHFSTQGDKPFTPEACPQLSPKACAVLNTPLKERDPRTLELVFPTFAGHGNQLMSPEAGVTDPTAALPNLWHRLNAALADTNNSTGLSTIPEPVPATPADALQDAPVVPPQPPAHAQASDPPINAAITAPAPQSTRHIAAPYAPVGHASQSSSTPGQSFRYLPQSFKWWRRRHVRDCPAFSPQSLRDALQCLPPPWRPWRLHRAALRDRAPNPAHIKKAIERGRRTAAPPSALELIPEIKSFAATQFVHQG